MTWPALIRQCATREEVAGFAAFLLIVAQVPFWSAVL